MKTLKQGDIIENRNGTEQSVLYVFQDGLCVLKDLSNNKVIVAEISEDNKGGYKEKDVEEIPA